MAKKILAIASGGGHWKQLMLLKPSFENSEVKFVTTLSGLPEQNNISNYSIVKDSNKDEKFNLIITFFQVLWVILKFRPDAIVTTGAAPGLLAIICGKLCGAKSIWVDSIANAEELSFAGRKSRKFADIVLSQWEHLADDKVKYEGSVF
ncbi:hypothetical protein [Agaribacter flavus]|uniref:Oligosaccharide biosynthesis protein Alg14 like protein n=1 Tax=Agaribacter flavus TaxID=1902781 RepID=A0ABV7FLU2_9ALTE